MVYVYNGILVSHQKEWSIDTYYDMNEPLTYYPNGRKPDTKKHILYGSIYKKYSEWVNP